MNADKGFDWTGFFLGAAIALTVLTLLWQFGGAFQLPLVVHDLSPLS